MHVQLIRFRLRGITEDRYRELCDELAPAFAEIPGLLAKVWLADAEHGVYGGLYLFRDRGAMDAFRASDLFAVVASTPQFVEITASDFAVLEEPSRVTQPVLRLLAGAEAS
jgi:hypothetical protein